MVNLKGLFDTTHHKLEAGEVVLEGRPYLGMSQLGHECSRYLWYQFRWAYRDTTSPRMIRLWARGHREEPIVIAELEKIGITVWGTDDGEVDEQLEMIAGHGHIKGHSDGLCQGVIEAPKTTHLFECKTVKDSGFKDLVKKRLEKYSPTYWAQVHLYMHHLKLTRTLFIAVNKNDDSYYVERVRYNKSVAEDLIRKGESIILADSPPDRAFPSKTFYKCRWCAAKEQCWSEASMVKNCRTCRFGEIAVGGTWLCAQPNEMGRVTLKTQRIGCNDYRELSCDT